MTHSNHHSLGLFAKLCAARNAVWQARGYGLDHDTSGQCVVSGDFGQFYLDAVSQDADAHIALELIRTTSSLDWNHCVEMASDDGINLAQSQDVFMMGKSLQDAIDHLS